MAVLKRLSHTTVVNMLDLCAYKVGLEKIVKLPRPTNGRLAVGTAFHAAIEAHENERRLYRLSGGKQGRWGGLSLPAMRTEAVTYSLAIADVDWEADELSYAAAQVMVLNAVEHWYDTPVPAGQAGEGGSLRDRVMQWQPVSIETWWSVWLPTQTSLPTVGAADVVYLKPDGRLVVVDNKSATRFGKWRLDGEGQRDQAAMYALAAMMSPGLPVRRDTIPEFEYHIARTQAGKTKRFEGARVVQIAVDSVDLDYIRARVGQAHQQMLSGEWPKNPDAWLCSPQWCPFHQDAGGPCDPHGPPEYDIAAS